MRALKLLSNSITNRDSRSVDLYFNEVNKIPLLTADEEIRYANASKDGDLKAREMLVKSNLRFVISVAKQYQNQGLALPDLISNGNMGLIKAAERFDPTRGFKFISYAVWWIRQQILLALVDTAKVVRIPLNKNAQKVKVTRAQGQLCQELEREPTMEEIAELTGMDITDVILAFTYDRYNLSLDAPISNPGDGGSEATLEDVIASSEPSTDSMLIDQSLKDDLKKVLSRLHPKEEDIVRKFFGIGCQAKTLEEIGMEMDLTRERVRQIKEKAIKRLRRSVKDANLNDYL